MTKRIAVVTGGMGGIGTAICRALNEQGLRVVAAYKRSPEAAKMWLAEEEKAGFDFDAVHVDVTDHESCEAMVKEVVTNIGPIDIVVNNAGITHDHKCHHMSIEEWNTVIQTDLSSIFYVTRMVVESMIKRSYGRIINISSINGQKGQYGQVNYSAAKAGMHGFTKALAREVAKYNITVNTVSPGYVATDMVLSLSKEVQEKILAEIPMGRFGEPEEVARIIAFLADEKTTYITGANIAINGGHYML